MAVAKPPETARLVLLVEDSADSREMYAHFLRHRGYRVVEVGTGEEALELTHALQPDAILMDLSLPGLDGYGATRELKRDPRTSAIPIVVLTAHASGDFETRARAAGCDGFLTKPASLRHVETALVSLIETRLASGVRPRVGVVVKKLRER